MGPREFCADVVEKNIADFHANYADLRHAFNAVAAVDALAAHLCEWCRTNAPHELAGGDDTTYRTLLAKRDSNFEMLRDVAKAHKHVRLTRGRPKVTLASQTKSREVGYGEGGFGLGRFGGPEQVVIDDNGGHMHYVETVVDDALAFLRTEMDRLGVP
jgi:hypothetical protein